MMLTVLKPNSGHSLTQIHRSSGWRQNDLMHCCSNTYDKSPDGMHGESKTQIRCHLEVPSPEEL